MTVEAATYISQLDDTKPLGSDFKSEGDNHLRLLKNTLKGSFPNFGTVAPANCSATEMNYLVGVTQLIQPVLDQVPLKAPIASPTFTGIPAGPTAALGTNTTQLATTEFVQSALTNSDAGLKYFLACSDLTSDLQVTTLAAYFRTQKALALFQIRASLATASSSGPVEIMVKVNGSNLLTGNLTIDAGEKSTVTASVNPGFTLSTIPDDAEVTVSIVSAGTGAKGLIVYVMGSV